MIGTLIEPHEIRERIASLERKYGVTTKEFLDLVMTDRAYCRTQFLDVDQYAGIRDLCDWLIYSDCLREAEKEHIFQGYGVYQT